MYKTKPIILEDGLAIKIPKEFQLKETEVTISKIGDSLVLTSDSSSLLDYFRKIKAYALEEYHKTNKLTYDIDSGICPVCGQKLPTPDDVKHNIGPHKTDSIPWWSITWSEFVDGIDYWSDERIVKYVDHIESFGTAEEVVDVLSSIPDEGSKDKFIRKAMEHVDFSMYDIGEMTYEVSDKLMRELIDIEINRKKTFSEKEMADIFEMLEDDLSAYIFRQSIKNGASYSKQFIMKYINYIDKDLFSSMISEKIEAGDDFSEEEMADIFDTLEDEQAIYILQQSIKNGASYSKQFIMEYVNYIDKDLFSSMISERIEAGDDFSEEEIANLDGCISDEQMSEVVDKLIEKKKVLSFDELMTVGENLKEDVFSYVLDRCLKNGAVYGSSELLELADYVDENLLGEEVLKLARSGQRFSVDDLMSFADYLNEDILTLVIVESAKNGTKLTIDQIINFGDYVDEDELIRIIEASNLSLTSKDLKNLEDYVDIELLHKLIENGKARYIFEPSEIIKVVQSANYAISYLVSAYNSLVSVENLSTAVILDFKRIFGVMKYAEISDAQKALDSAANALICFGEDLRVIKFGLSFKVDDFLSMADVIMDSKVDDFLAQRKIEKAIRECDFALDRVKSVREKLVAMLPDEYKK